MKYISLLALVTFAIFGCAKDTSKDASKSAANTTKAPSVAPNKTKANAKPPSATTTPKVKAKPGEVVFDPKNPPAGFTICHRNHCHRQGGGVASYDQVMKEIGATKAINVPKRAPMPKAPTDVAGPGSDAKVTGSGVASKLLKAGSGKAKPKANDIVTVHYTGWTTDGKPFDSSVARGEPATFPLNRVPKGWAEGIQLMVVGEERRIWVPEHLAFQGQPRAPKGMIVFDVELLGIGPPN